MDKAKYTNSDNIDSSKNSFGLNLTIEQLLSVFPTALMTPESFLARLVRYFGTDDGTIKSFVEVALSVNKYERGKTHARAVCIIHLAVLCHFNQNCFRNSPKIRESLMGRITKEWATTYFKIYKAVRDTKVTWKKDVDVEIMLPNKVIDEELKVWLTRPWPKRSY
jgi:hypothetical protein